MTPQESFAALMLAAVAADDELTEAEVRTLSATLQRMRLFAGQPDLPAQLGRLAADLRRDGFGPFVGRAAQALPADLRKTAFVNACDLVLSDGVGREGEDDYLRLLQREWGYADEFVSHVADVMALKNRA